MAKGRKVKIKTTKAIVPVQKTGLEPEVMSSFASSYPARIKPTGIGFDSLHLQFPNLYKAGLPFQYGTNCTVSVSDAVLLCQKAYCRVGSFKTAIDIMTEICANSSIYLDGGNNESVTFFEAWLKRINIEKTKDQFFRELFRSGNIFLYRIDGTMTTEDAKKIKRNYSQAEKIDLPLRYILLNPGHIAVYGGLNFENPVYVRLLNKFELDVLKSSNNEDDREIYKNLPAAMKNYFDGGTQFSKPVPLDKTQLHTVFYKKQDYEPFAVPLGFAILDSLELKLAMQKCDSILARTVEYSILLITMGAGKEDGGTNPESLKLLKEAFKSEQVGRVLVADYTTKASFVIPDLGKIFGEEKYKVVNRDIAEGLMNIFFEQENRQINLAGKLKVFVEKINAAQNLFLNDFLTPEIKRISKLMGFKTYPTPSMGRTNLDDQDQMMRVYAQLLQLGVLTPKDGLEAMERGIFPEYDNLHTNQEAFKKDKDVGLFQPVTGSPYTQLQIAKLNAKAQASLQDSQQEHQLNQTKMQNQHDLKTTKLQQDHEVKNPKPVSPTLQVVTKPVSPNLPKGGNPTGTGRPPGAKGKISMAKLIENVKLHSHLIDKVTNAYKNVKKVKKLKAEDNEIIKTISGLIIASENPDKWLELVEEYINDPKQVEQNRILDLQELSGEYGISDDSAAIIFHSIIKDEE